MSLSPKKYFFLYAIVVLILIGLQAFYIFNSYKLQEKELNSDAIKIVSSFIEQMNNLENEDEEVLIRSFKMLSHDKQKQFNELNFIQSEIIKRHQYLSLILDSLLTNATQKNGFEIAVEKKVYSIYDELNSKEILGNKPLIIYQTKSKVINPRNINENIWSTNDLTNESDTDLGIDVREEHKYKIRSSVDYELKNVNLLVIKKITPLILISALILIFLIYLYTITLKNLSLQEKKIKELHLTIDSIAHELNTPITTLKFASQQIEDSSNKTIIQRQISRLENTVQAIFLEDNSEEELVQELEVENYLNGLKNHFSNVAILENISYQYNHVLSKKDFELIVYNLIENSSKYGADTIELNLNFDKNIFIKVSDNGLGIPEEEFENIFKKYFRVNRGVNQNVGGMGVGLYLVKNCVEQNGGNIKVSNQKNGGVQFEITIPNGK